MKTLASMAIVNIKHSQILHRIKIKVHMKVFFVSVPITQYIMSGFQQKITIDAKRQEKAQSTQPNKHQNQIQIGDRCWNYQKEKCKII